MTKTKEHNNIYRIVRGNTFATKIHVRAVGTDGTEIAGFDLAACTDIKVTAHLKFMSQAVSTFSVSERNSVVIVWPASLQKIGCYGIEVMGKMNGLDWRFFLAHAFSIVETNFEAYIPEGSFIDTDYYLIDADLAMMMNISVKQQADFSFETVEGGIENA